MNRKSVTCRIYIGCRQPKMKHRISAAATDGDNGMRFLSPTYWTLASGNTRGPQMRLSRPLRHGYAQHLVSQCGRSTKYIAPQRSLRFRRLTGAYGNA